MEKNKINILDCTLRDGGYYNNWEFKKDLINEYLKVMEHIKVDYVEIGFRFIDKIKTKGPCAYSEENFLKSLKIPKNLKIGIMINAADFVNNSDIISLAKKSFKRKKNSIISLIRVACHYNELESITPLINWLKKSGYKVGINIMQIPELSFKEIKNYTFQEEKYKKYLLIQKELDITCQSIWSIDYKMLSTMDKMKIMLKNNHFLKIIQNPQDKLEMCDGAYKYLTMILEQKKEFVIVTNNVKTNVDYICIMFPILKQSKKIYTRDMFVYKKPDPECYLQVLRDFPNKKMIGVSLVCKTVFFMVLAPYLE